MCIRVYRSVDSEFDRPTFKCVSSPTPESIRSWGELTAPPHTMISAPRATFFSDPAAPLSQYSTPTARFPSKTTLDTRTFSSVDKLPRLRAGLQMGHRILDWFEPIQLSMRISHIIKKQLKSVLVLVAIYCPSKRASLQQIFIINAFPLVYYHPSTADFQRYTSEHSTACMVLNYKLGYGGKASSFKGFFLGQFFNDLGVIRDY